MAIAGPRRRVARTGGGARGTSDRASRRHGSRRVRLQPWPLAAYPGRVLGRAVAGYRTVSRTGHGQHQRPWLRTLHPGGSSMELRSARLSLQLRVSRVGQVEAILMFRRINHGVAVLALVGTAVCADRAALPAEGADHATAVMEWVLDVQFSPAQRMHYQEMLGKMWRSGGKGSDDAIAGMARAHQALADVRDSERDRMRATKQQDFVRLLESGTDDNSRWLLSVYREAHS